MELSVEIKPYIEEYQEQVLGLLRSNIPAFFAPAEEQDFYHFLTEEKLPYFVMLHDAIVVGSGGYGLQKNGSVFICWDLIHPDFQGQKLGKKLLKYRIDLIKSIYSTNDICVRTSQLVYSFYEKNGFILKEIAKDYWAKGYDLYFMKYEINNSAYL